MHKDTVSQHFDQNWQSYLQAVNNGLLCHLEMFTKLESLINEHFQHKPFILADIGCGDGSAIVGVLQNKPISRYIGVDAAAEVLKNAPSVLETLDCEKEFICDDMANAIIQIQQPLDIIVCSYSLHHLSLAKKLEFIKNCQNQLQPNGYMILIDGVLAKNQDRDQWLEALENRFFAVNKEASEERIAAFKKHIHNDDHPESIATYQQIANDQDWKHFEVLIDKEILAFMVFKK